MKKYIRLLALLLFKLLPKSKFYKFKNKLLNLVGMKISLSARIFSTVQIFGPNIVEIGDDTFIGHEVLITGSKDSQVIIGNYVDIAPKVIINTGTHHIDTEGLHVAGKGIGKDIIIKNGSWIGMGSILLPGITIGQKSIIAAGSIVTKDVEDNVLVAGNPAVVKRRLK